MGGDYRVIAPGADAEDVTAFEVDAIARYTDVVGEAAGQQCGEFGISGEWLNVCLDGAAAADGSEDGPAAAAAGIGPGGACDQVLGHRAPPSDGW